MGTLVGFLVVFFLLLICFFNFITSFLPIQKDFAENIKTHNHVLKGIDSSFSKFNRLLNKKRFPVDLPDVVKGDSSIHDTVARHYSELQQEQKFNELLRRQNS